MVLGISLISRCLQHFQNSLGEMLVDLGVPRDWLRNFGGGIEIPIVLATVSNEETAERFKLANKILSLHGRVNSASFRTPGTAPVDKSL
jgi:hypothetical protein